MKQLLLIALLALASIPSLALANGDSSCTVSDVTSAQIAGTNNRISDSGTVIVTLVCIGDSGDGSFPATTIPLNGPATGLQNRYNLTGYVLYQVGRTPGSTQPSGSYTVTITDSRGFAVDLGLLTTNGSASAAQLTAMVASVAAGSITYPTIRGNLTVAITATTVHSANITLDLIFRAQL